MRYNKRMKKNRYVILAAGVVALLLLGVIYAWSVFVAPLEAAFGWQRSQTSTVFTLSMCFFCLGGIPGGLLVKRIGSHNVLRLSALFLLIGFACAAFFASLPGLYIGYGVLCGLGVGLGYNAVLSCVIRWFPDKPGLCNGMLLMGFGCGALLLSAACSALMAALGWRTTFYWLAVGFALILFACSFLLRLPAAAQQVAAKTSGGDLTTGAMLKRPSFYLLFIWVTLLAAGGMMVIGSAAPLAGDAGAAAALAALVPGVISACNGLGRVLFGNLFDRFGARKTLLCVTLCNMLALLLLCGAFALQGPALPLFLAGCCLLGAGYGGCPLTLSACVNAFYGSKYYPTNLAAANLHIVFASLLGSQAAGSLYVRLGSYVPMLWGFLLLTLIPLACVFLMKEKKKAVETA